MSFEEAKHRPQVNSGGEKPSKGETVYVGFFWSEMHMEVTFQITSMDAAQVIKGANIYLSKQDIPDMDYKIFLADRVSTWNGAGPHITTIPGGKLVMLASALEPSASQMASSATG